MTIAPGAAQPVEPPAAAAGPPPMKTVVSLDGRSVWRSAILVLGLVAGFILLLWLFSVTSHFLFLVLLAWLFAIALEPGIRRLMSAGLRRGVAATIMGGVTILVAIVLAAIFGQLFFNQIVQLVHSIPNVATSLVDWLNRTFHTHLDAAAIDSSLNITPGQIASWAESLSGGVLGIVGSLSAVMFDLVTVLVFGFYFAADGPHFLATIGSGLPPRAQRVFVTVSEITTEKTGGYVVSKIVLAALSAVCHAIFFAAIGVPYWLPFALFVGITAQFVPLIGTYIGVAVPVLATVFTSTWKAIAIILFAVVYQQIETYVFTPRISKKTMDVNPAIALGAVFVGAAIWGPIGAIIGIPLAAAGVAIFDTYKQRYDLVPELQASVSAGMSGPADDESDESAEPARPNGRKKSPGADEAAEPDETAGPAQDPER
jgi:predicted PurR-regulated permease PerM